MASVALGGEHVAVVGERLAQRRQHPQLIAPDRVNTGLAALGPPDMQRGRSPKLHLRPLQLAGLLGAQAVTVGPQGSGWRPDAPAARLRRLEQLLDLGGQQVSGRLGVCGPGRRQGGDPRRGGYLLRGATGGARGDIVQEIIAIVRQVASGLPPEPPNPLDDGLPGG